MATIKFTTNLISNKSIPWQFNPNDLNGIPETPGVYIVGVKIIVNDFDNPIEKKEKFCPLYVGIQQNLKAKISGHRDPINKNTGTGELNSFKELFDLKINGDAVKLYDSINRLLELREKIEKIKGSKKLNHLPNGNTPSMPFPINCRKCAEELTMFHVLKEERNLLIWFPNPAFFNINIKSNTFISKYAYHDSGKNGNYNHSKSLNHDLLHPDAYKLLNRIIDTKNIISNKYWYAFASTRTNPNIDFSDNAILQQIEAATKWKLMNKLNIPTYAGINGAGEGIWNALEQGKNVNLDINLKDIQSELVNMTGASFPTKLIL
jgi:hypothetical protein